MKNVFRLLIIAALASVFALPAFAQGTQPAAAQGPCAETDAQAALYQKFRDNFKGTPDQQKVAYESGKEYLSKYGSCTDESIKQIATYVQNWVKKYEDAVVNFNCTKAVNENPAQAFQACSAVIQKNPDDPKYHLMLVAAGINNNVKNPKDTSLNARAAAEARTALQLIESGKTSDSWAPFASQQDAPSGLRYYIALWTYDSNPEEAATQLLKVAQSNSTFAKEFATYNLLGASYYSGEYKKLAQDYKDKCEGKEATPECDALLNKINAVTDRIIDAYARAVALSKGKPEEAKLRSTLTTFYKQRHEGKEDGLNELIANVLSKPVMLPGQEPAPTPTPSSTSGTDGNGTTAKPAATPATTPANNNQTKPASNPPTKPPVSKSNATSGAARSAAGH